MFMTTYNPTDSLSAWLRRRGWFQGVQLLLSADAAVDVPNKRGLTALGEAVAGGHAKASEALIKAGADLCCRTAGCVKWYID